MPSTPAATRVTRNSFRLNMFNRDRFKGSKCRPGFKQTGFKRKKMCSKNRQRCCRIAPSTRAASARRAMDADGESGIRCQFARRRLLLCRFDQHSAQCGRRRQNLGSFHNARSITIKDRISQFAAVKNRNCGGTRELDDFGGWLRGLVRSWDLTRCSVSCEIRRTVRTSADIASSLTAAAKSCCPIRQPHRPLNY